MEITSLKVTESDPEEKQGVKRQGALTKRLVFTARRPYLTASGVERSNKGRVDVLR